MTLNFESFGDQSKKKSKTKYKAALGVGSAVSLFGIGSTLAANISLNSGTSGAVEFGQGVVTTAACDQDGFTITPVTFFDNDDEIFKIDYVQVSGVNLTAEGFGWDDPDLDSIYANQAAAKQARPGKYYDTISDSWKNTCDGVVLDFKAYTDDNNYIDRTVIDNSYSMPNLQNPIGWRQDHDPGDTTYNWEPGFALVVDITDDGLFESNYLGKNSAVDNEISGQPWNMDFDVVNYSGGIPSNSTFNFYVTDYYRKTDAASVSKITVQSMNQFPSSYKAFSDVLGNPQDSYVIYTPGAPDDYVYRN
jgi:hypothetical protein